MTDDLWVDPTLAAYDAWRRAYEQDDTAYQQFAADWKVENTPLAMLSDGYAPGYMDGGVVGSGKALVPDDIEMSGGSVSGGVAVAPDLVATSGGIEASGATSNLMNFGPVSSGAVNLIVVILMVFARRLNSSG